MRRNGASTRVWGGGGNGVRWGRGLEKSLKVKFPLPGASAEEADIATQADAVACSVSLLASRLCVNYGARANRAERCQPLRTTCDRNLNRRQTVWGIVSNISIGSPRKIRTWRFGDGNIEMRYWGFLIGKVVLHMTLPCLCPPWPTLPFWRARSRPCAPHRPRWAYTGSQWWCRSDSRSGRSRPCGTPGFSSGTPPSASGSWAPSSPSACVDLGRNREWHHGDASCMASKCEGSLEHRYLTLSKQNYTLRRDFFFLCY